MAVDPKLSAGRNAAAAAATKISSVRARRLRIRPGSPAIRSTHRRGIAATAPSVGNSALNCTEPTIVGGAGSPMNGNARTLPSASGRTAASNVVGMNCGPTVEPVVRSQEGSLHGIDRGVDLLRQGDRELRPKPNFIDQ